jgi:copper resistance protein B
VKRLSLGVVLFPLTAFAQAQPEAMPAMPGMAHHDESAPAGDAPEPAPPTDFAADHVYDPKEMAAARAASHAEHGGETFSMVLLNLAEYQASKHGGYRWDAEAWYGGDADRLVMKTEGLGESDAKPESAELQALYSRAIGPYFNLQAGARYDFRPDPSRLYATIGVEGLAPYYVQTVAALFLSTKGDVLARVEAYHDMTLTQRFILQPRAELNFAAQDVRETRTGSGLSNAELGLRLRYEIRREFAPYIGVSYDRMVGATARYARAAGEDVGGTRFVAGLHAWF